MIGWYLDLLIQVPITTNVANPANGGVYSIQHYAIKLVSDLRHVVGFSGFLHQ